ncbi:MAG TPA: CHAP domain-containing protein, partial [Cyclobacteriaceae bacterium]|nr:CHAP domain-containing protein [Cyclobacteriaceae bacterium]
SGRILNNLYKKVLVALRKYKRAVDEYQASINQTQPGRGGGPSLFEDEIEMLMPVLPPCLDEYRDQMRTISANITTYLDSGEYASIEFGVDVATVLSDEFTTEESQDNAPQEKVDVAVCVALVGKLFKTFFNSKYVVVKNTLKQTAWGTTKGKDQFAQDIVAGVDSKLELLDKDTLKTLILITSLWVHKGNNVEASLETEREKILKESKAYLAKDLVFSDFNLLVIVISKYDTALNDGERKSKFNEAFYPMDGLDSSCVKSVRDYINSDSKKQWINGLDEALMERTEKLLEKLKGCKVEKPEIDDSGNKRAEIANRMDGSDTRRYGRFLEPARLTDVYVDCAEFVYDVLTEEGFKIASGDCEIQSDWYKAREETKLCVTGSNPSDVVVGDILLWKGNWKGAKEYAHTGIVVQVAENVVHVVNAGNQGCHCDNGWDDYKVKNKEGIEVQVFKTMEECYKEKCKNPAIWKSTGYFNASTLNSKDHTFKYWARPNLTK